MRNAFSLSSIAQLISVSQRRAGILRQLFPGAIPKLWCPTLTHYDADGGLDASRIARHLTHLSGRVKGILVPGSTGDGWELSDVETRRLLEIVLEQGQELNLHVLIGVLKAETQKTVRMLRETMDWLKARTQEPDADRALSAARICGFTVCAPRGKDLSQEEIERGLVAALESGLPMAVYQLPQVTQNEISPEVAVRLAQRFENFILFKDSSGADRIVQSGKDLGGVFTMRGAEGDYARWLKTAGGPYDGFLLSTANCFARELCQVMGDLEAGRAADAEALSHRITAVVREVFEIVKELPLGNPFTNANKAIDHFFAHGARAARMPAPRLYAGAHLPDRVIQETEGILSQHRLLPAQGYLRA